MSGSAALRPITGSSHDPHRAEYKWQFHVWFGEAALFDGRLDAAEREITAAHAIFARPATFALLAEIDLARGKYLRAEQRGRLAELVLGFVYGAESPEVARCMNIRARACAALGFDAEAAELVKRAYAIRAKKLPKNHPDITDSVRTQVALLRAGSVYPLIVNGLPERILDISHAPDHLDRLEAALPAGDPRRAECQLVRGRLASRVRVGDDTPAAEKPLNDAIALLAKVYGPNHPVLADGWSDLARLYGIQGKLERAAEAQDKALAILRARYGAHHPRLAWALANMSEIQRARGNNTAAAALLEDASRVHFSALTDRELCTAFDRRRGHGTEYLVEMSRRKGPEIAECLERRYHEYLDVQRQAKSVQQWPDVELFTALRRAQNKPDPLQIVVSGPEELETIFPNLPVIEAALVNRDSQKQPVTFRQGGDYRSGRQDRWRFDVRDPKGNIVPIKAHRGIIEAGGLVTLGVLKDDDSWDTMLPMRKFIDLPPGDYTVTVQYHDQKTISDLPYTAGFIVCRSEPFKLHVQPRVLDVTRRDREAAKAALAELDDKAPVLLLEGTYGKDDHEFIKPDSATGKLLALGWRAVPALLDELENGKSTPKRRALVLAALFSITSWNDPYPVSGVLGKCEVRSRGWAVSGGRNGKTYALGLGSGGALILRSDTIDVETQNEFAKRWKAARDYIVVREKP